MISASGFKAHFLAVFKAMAETGMYVDVHWHGHLYRLHIEDLHTKVHHPNKGRRKLSYVSMIRDEACPDCGKLMINSVCMSGAH